MNEEKTKPVEGQEENQELDELTQAQNRIIELEHQLADEKAQHEISSKNHLMYYRQVQVLKAAMEHLRSELNITDATFYASLLCGCKEDINIDDLLFQLSK